MVDDGVLTDRSRLLETLYAQPDKLLARAAVWGNRAGPSLMSTSLDRLGLTGDETVLDIGCGAGLYLAELRRRGHAGRLIGLDLSVGMARASAEYAPSLVADVSRLPIVDGAADVALAMHMLYHLKHPAMAIGQLRRVTRPGGTALAAANGAGHIAEIREVVDAAAVAVGGRADARPRYSFNAEAGADQLSVSFADVTRHEARQVVPVPSADVVLGYIGSLEPESCGVTAGPQWTELLAVAADRVAERIRRSGGFAVTSHTAVFVCR